MSNRVSTLQFYSVRTRLTLYGVVLPVVLLGCLVLVYSFAASALREQTRSKEANFQEFNSLSGLLKAEQTRLALLQSDMTRLRAMAPAVVRRINELASEYHVTPNNVSEKVSKSSLQIQKPMTNDSSGLHLVVTGTPERLCNFFGALEAAFPALVVQESRVSISKDQLAVDTTYLLPSYAPVR